MGEILILASLAIVYLTKHAWAGNHWDGPTNPLVLRVISLIFIGTMFYGGYILNFETYGYFFLMFLIFIFYLVQIKIINRLGKY